jgi:hypothetical protein
MGDNFRNERSLSSASAILGFAQARVRAHGVHAPADDYGWVQSSGRQDSGHHRRGGGLAVHARDRDSVLQAHQLGEHLGALNDRDVQLAGLGDLGVVGGDGGTGNDDLGVADIFRGMTFDGERAERSQALRHAGTLQIRAGDSVAEVQQHLGNAAHADAADAYEMDALDFGEHGLADG